jgi:hypothetical protein
MGVRAGVDEVEKRKILHCRESNPDRPAYSPSLYRLSYPDSQINNLLKLSLYHLLTFLVGKSYFGLSLATSR